MEHESRALPLTNSIAPDPAKHNGGYLPHLSDAGSQRTYWHALWERKFLILLGAVVGLGLSYLSYIRQAPTYQASTRVLVIKKDPNPLPTGANDPRLSYFEDYVGTQAVIVRSPVVLERVAKRSEIKALPWYNNETQAVDRLVNNLSVTKGEGRDQAANILNFSYRSASAEECGLVLAILIECYKEFIDTTYENVSKKTLLLINEAKNDLDKQIQAKRDELNKVRNNMPPALMRFSKEGQTISGERLTALQAKINDLSLRKSELEVHLSAFEQASKDPKTPRQVLIHMANQFYRAAAIPNSTGPGDARIDAAGRDPLLEMKMQEFELKQQWGPDSKQVKQFNSRMQNYLRLLQEQKTPLPVTKDKTKPIENDPLEMHVLFMKQDLKGISEQLVREQLRMNKEMDDAKGLETHENLRLDLEGDLKRFQQLHEDVLKKLDQINLARNLGGYRIEVIQAPPSMGGQIAPNRNASLSVGLTIGLFGGLALAYLAELADKSFRTPSELTKRLGFPVVGHVPAMDGAIAASNAKEHAGIDPQLFTYLRPKSKHSESFRQVRTALYFSTHGGKCKTIQITSPRAGDGKTTIASNLAICIAQSGKKVLLVDADCRRPRVHKMFGFNNEKGLTNILSGNASPADVIRETQMPGLSLMTAGPSIPNPAEAITSEEFPALLKKLGEEFDVVLIDSPPLLAVTDPSVVAVRVDGVIVVVRVGRAERLDAERAAEMLRTLRAKVLGVIVNGCEPGAGYRYNYGYKSYYYGNYRYGYGYNRYGYYYGRYGRDDYYYGSDEEDQEKAAANGSSNGTSNGSLTGDPIDDEKGRNGK